MRNYERKRFGAIFWSNVSILSVCVCLVMELISAGKYKGSNFIGYPGTLYHQGADTFFRKTSEGEDIYERKGAKTKFSLKPAWVPVKFLLVPEAKQVLQFC